MKAADFRTQYPSGYEHQVVLVFTKRAPPVWEGSKGRFLRDEGDFVVLEVTSGTQKFDVRVPWGQVDFDKPKSKA